MRNVARVMIVTMLTLTAAAQEFPFDAPPQGKPLPFRVLPVENLSAFVKNWDDESMPRYAIIGNIHEWRSEFAPAAVIGDNRPPEPNPAIFEKAALVLVARVSENPPKGHHPLFVKSFELVEGEAVLTYGFFPPESAGAFKVKNTMLVAIPLEYHDGIRIIEEVETKASMAAARELEAAKAAGRVKPPALNR